MRDSFGPAMPLRLPLIVLWTLVAAHVFIILVANEGHFVYSLDDAYIHLSLAEGIASGLYGLNPGEPAAPSSSILWPFLLVPLVNTPLGHLVPFLLNLAAASSTLWIYARICAAGLPGPSPFDDSRSRLFHTLLLVLLIPGTNLVGLLFTGMEHSLQILATATIVLGLVRELETGRPPGWLFGALALAPLVRYEEMAIVLPALAYLAWRRHLKPVLGTGAAIAATVGGFSLFLYSQGLGLVPASILAKSKVAFHGNRVYSTWQNLSNNLSKSQGAFLAALLLAFVVLCVTKRRPVAERRLAGALAAAVCLHLLFGQFGWFFRYEIYMWTAAVLAFLYFFRQGRARLIEDHKPATAVLVLLLFVVLPCRHYLYVLHTSPIACGNIYEQQYQMHRFLTESYRRPVGVNDLGWVTYRNDVYVLDFFGLASRAALDIRRQEPSGTVWLEKLARERDVKLVMLYTDWFPQVPVSWIPVGVLRLGGKRVTAAQDEVTFYARGAETFYEVQGLLAEFRATLPEGTSLVLYPEARTVGGIRL